MKTLDKEPEIVITDAKWQPVAVVPYGALGEFAARFGRKPFEPFNDAEIAWLRERQVGELPKV